MASSWKDVQSKQEIEDLHVRLKPIFGIAPERYIVAVWAAALLLASFLLFVLPGLRNYGTKLTITSSPEGAQVLIDERRVGATPVDVFVEAGPRTVTVSHPGQAEVLPLEVRGRRIAGLFFPRRDRIHVALDRIDYDAVVAPAVADFASWALKGSPSAQFQIPPVAHNAARVIWADRDARTVGIDTFLVDLLAHGTTDQTGDTMAAIIRTANPRGAVSPLSLSEIVHFFIHLDNTYPTFLHVVDAFAEADATARRVVSDSAWILRREEALSTALLAASIVPDEQPAPSARLSTVGGIRFARVPAGRYVLGYPLRGAHMHGEPVRFADEFWIQDSEVTRGQYARFLSTHPEWAPARRSSLVADGLADPRYLEDWPEDWMRWLDDTAIEAMQPVRYVSWYAAEAYAAWVNEVAAPAIDALLPGATVVLPTAAQWEYAAFLNGLGAPTVVGDATSPRSAAEAAPGALGVYHLVGNLWEWTADWHAEHRVFHAPTSGDQRVVSGGSFANSDVSHSVAGAQPPQWSTPFLGFRLALTGPRFAVEYDG
ncbi:MAG: SUMF1/EgtB/PvdO family nonheme iron enzyme [Spirochaetales bacterium]|nr:SUMF1/EgtB/PvdO family nonheme iron enzyme [Spirochaetales bacterium]